MNTYNKKHAFTLAEIMVVLLIMTIIFAAFAPLITKKRGMATQSRYNVWNYMDTNLTMNAAYNPGDPAYTGELLVGITPNGKADIKSTFLPLSKLIIRSGGVTSSQKVQRQMQFRYGRTSPTDKGKFAGTWLMDGKNILLGGSYAMNGISGDNIQAINNVSIGYASLTKLSSGKNNTALGAYSLNRVTSTDNNTALGYYAGRLTTGTYNTFAGSYAGANVTGSYNTALGYAASYGDSSGSTGTNNVFIGANAGKSIKSGSRNVGIGYNALANLTTGEYNTAIGYNALGSLTSGKYNVALGYNACQNVTTGSYKTCIGYNSGPQPGSTGEKYLGSASDSTQRTYIGSKPKSFGGDAVLEIHNITGSNSSLMNSPTINSNITTVINGNLVVKGRALFTVGNNMHGWQHDEIHGSSSEFTFGDYSGSHKCATNQTTYSFASNCPNLTTSDRRLKNIGTKSLAGLKEINKLKIYNYTFKDDNDKKQHVGVMAQDLEKIFPNAVFEDEKGYLKIRWDEMFFASINAIKELDNKIIALIKRTTNVETQIAQLESENKVLKSQVESLTARVEKLKNK